MSRMKTFGELGRSEKLRILGAWIDGHTIERYGKLSHCWAETRPTWHNDITYRVKPKPAPCEGREVEIDGVTYELKAKS